jgi:RNA exonuclease 4
MYKNSESPCRTTVLPRDTNANAFAFPPRPGRYLAVDCEMVGVGIDGAESSLARVSMVNFHGAIMLDVFVRQKERVVDYRTEFSGIRPVDMVHGTHICTCAHCILRTTKVLTWVLEAKPFEEAQKEVAEMLEGRVLVGHAVHNDLKVWLRLCFLEEFGVEAQS